MFLRVKSVARAASTTDEQAQVDALHLADSLVSFSPEGLAAADVVFVLVDHPEFDPAFIAEHSSLVFDTKNLLKGHEFRGELL